MMPGDRKGDGNGDSATKTTLSKATAPPPGSIVLRDKMARQLTWVPKTPRTDLLSKECLADVQSHNMGATGVAKGRRRDVDLTHIINPFPTSDVHFHWTLPAIIGAHRRAKEAGLHIEVLAFTFEDEDLEGVWPDFVSVRWYAFQSLTMKIRNLLSFKLLHTCIMLSTLLSVIFIRHSTHSLLLFCSLISVSSILVFTFCADVTQVLPILWPNRTAGAHLERLGVEFDKEEKPLRGPIVSGASRIGARMQLCRKNGRKNALVLVS